MPPVNKQTVKAKGKRAALKVIRTVPLDSVAALPGQGGRVGQRAVLAQARSLLRETQQPDQAIRLLSRIPADQLGDDGNALIAEAFAAVDEQDRAWEYASKAAAGPKPSVEALVVALRAADRLALTEEHDALLLKATQAVPRTEGQANGLIAAFRSPDRALVDRFVANARTWKVAKNETTLAVLETETHIRNAGDDDAIVAAAIAAGRRDVAGLRAATRVLPEHRAFDELADVYRHQTNEVIAQMPPKTILAAAQRTLKAGRLEAAATLAARLMETHSKQPAARDLYNRARDQVHIARTGWPIDEAAEATHERRPRAVLSVLAQSLPHRSGGYATRSHGVLTGLRNLGWDMTAVTRLGFPYDRWPTRSTEEVDPFDVVDGVTYTRLLEPGERVYDNTPLAAYIERFSERILDEAVKHGASLIHASSFQNNGLAGLRAARKLGIPFVYEMRGLEDLMKISRDPKFGSTSAYRYMTGLELHIAQQADLTFVITEALRGEMIERGAPAERLVVLPNGVHTSQFEPREPDQDLIRELGLEGKMIVGYAGGLVDYEGLDLLLHAAAQIKKQRQDFAVIIVGDGHYEATLHKLARDLDVLDVVQFTGRVPHSEVARYLSIFQVTPFPRLPLPVCELISPIKPFESMAMGKAVISSDVAALAEIVEGDVRGLLFRKGDATDLAAKITAYLEDPELRERMGRQAREWVLAERDWSDICRIVDEAYERVLPQG
ncbi:glycosyltransferase family 4 protein [Janibacter sp. G1551]|uniref:glycosyltransferase family 4 protein n=1 Tax=Janibacter sp. G1551 TaxID=3420440 RepID=UPI003D04DDCA